MRRPSDRVVVDASLLISACIGRNRRAVHTVGAARRLVTSERAVAESSRRIELGLKRPDLLDTLAEMLPKVEVVAARTLRPLTRRAARALVDAPASRNGSDRDAHLLACAWAVEGDIWTFDRDFAGTGVASWSTANLLRALAKAAV